MKPIYGPVPSWRLGRSLGIDPISQKVFDIINKTMDEIKFNSVVKGIRDFKGIYKGKLALQIM